MCSSRAKAQSPRFLPAFPAAFWMAARRLRFGQTLSISHPLGKAFGLSGKIRRFTQSFLRWNAIRNLRAPSSAARKNLAFDADFEKGLTGTWTHWEAFAGFPYLLPRRLGGKSFGRDMPNRDGRAF
jgi:hypothetical protein